MAHVFMILNETSVLTFFKASLFQLLLTCDIPHNSADASLNSSVFRPHFTVHL